MRDVVIVGAGHHGLVTAACLGKAGVKPLVLERADSAGGCALTSAIAPGFQVPTLAHRAALDPRLIASLNLRRHGLETLQGDARICVPAIDGRALTLWNQPADAARDIEAFSRQDAERYPQFLASVAGVSRVLRRLLNEPAPSPRRRSLADVSSLFRTFREFRALDKKDARRLLRWLPMSVADLMHEWFESEPLCAAVGAGGILGAFLGPRSPGSAAVLLLLGAGEGDVVAPGWSARGGMGAIASALANAARAH